MFLTIVTETTFGTDLSQLGLARISFITNITIADGRQSLRITISLVVAIVWTISDCAIRARPSLIASASVIGWSCVTSSTEIAIALTRHIITRADFNLIRKIYVWDIWFGDWFQKVNLPYNFVQSTRSYKCKDQKQDRKLHYYKDCQQQVYNLSTVGHNHPLSILEDNYILVGSLVNHKLLNIKKKCLNQSCERKKNV